MSSGEIDARIARFSAQIDSDREILRRKVGQLLRKFNRGESKISLYGLASIDLVVEFERRLNLMSDSEVREALAIVRE